MSNVDEKKVDKKRESEKPCNVDINTSISVSLRHLDKPTSGEAGVMGEGGVLVMQQSTTEVDADKVDTNAKSDAPDTSDASDASDASNASNIDTPNINVKRGIRKKCANKIKIY